MSNSTKQSPVTEPRRHLSPLRSEDCGDLLARYVWRSACSTAAGLGTFGLVTAGALGLADSSQGEVLVKFQDNDETKRFFQRSLVELPGGPPAGYAPIESTHFANGIRPTQYPFRNTRWLTEGFAYQYNPLDGAGNPVSTPTAAYGIDLDFNSVPGGESPDLNFFRGDDYLHVRTDFVSYYGAGLYLKGSFQVHLLSNDRDNLNNIVDRDNLGTPNWPPDGSGTRKVIQGFSYGERIGGDYHANAFFPGPDGGDTDKAFGNDRLLVVEKSGPYGGTYNNGVEGVMRAQGYPGDWDNNNDDPNFSGSFDNFGTKYVDQGGWTDPSLTKSYVGFVIDLDNDPVTGVFGFGWMEVIVRDAPDLDGPGGPGVGAPEIQVLRWAYTDDGSPIYAGRETLPGAGDLNFDDAVDGNDFLDWQLGFGTDFNDDDLRDWIGAYEPSSVAAASTAAVPEPTSLGLLAAGAGAWALRRKKR